jgi:indolepyruvate ferredoxin oxidoreductase
VPSGRDARPAPGALARGDAAARGAAATAPGGRAGRRERRVAAHAEALVDTVTREPGELRRALDVRVGDLLGWGGARPARAYVEVVGRMRAIEAERVPGSTALAEEVARGLHKLMAYKDEYEVARLHVEGVAALPRGTKVAFHLHPPLLRVLGLKRKLKLGRWFLPALRVLRHGRVLRGTPLDPFGYAHVRRVERALPGEYLTLVEEALPRLSPATLPLALELAALPELVRGYEQIKLAGVERFRARAEELRARRAAGELPDSIQIHVHRVEPRTHLHHEKREELR